MAEFRPGTPEQEEFLAELVDAGLLVESGVSGVYGRDEAFERIRRGFDDRGQRGRGGRQSRAARLPAAAAA